RAGKRRCGNHCWNLRPTRRWCLPPWREAGALLGFVDALACRARAVSGETIMSDAGQSASAGQSEGADATARAPSGEPAPFDRGSANPPGPWRRVVVMAIGGLICGGLAVGALGLVHKNQPDAAGLQMVATSDLNEASLTLEPTVARTATEEARQCK